MSVAITEPLSMDWLVEQDLANLPAYLDSLKTSTRWYPRLGEIVLVARNLKDGQLIRFDTNAGICKIHDLKLGWVGLPVWEAVVVTQITKNTLTAGRLAQKQNTEGSDEQVFRVEPMPEIDEAQLAQRVLSAVQKQIDGMIEFRLREALAPILARHSEALVRDLHEELNRTMRDVVARSVSQEMAKLRHR